MKRLVEISISSCDGCPYLETESSNLSSHYFLCKKMNLTSSDETDNFESVLVVGEELDNWFRNKCTLQEKE